MKTSCAGSDNREVIGGVTRNVQELQPQVSDRQLPALQQWHLHRHRACRMGRDRRARQLHRPGVSVGVTIVTVRVDDVRHGQPLLARALDEGVRR